MTMFMTNMNMEGLEVFAASDSYVSENHEGEIILSLTNKSDSMRSNIMLEIDPEAIHENEAHYSDDISENLSSSYSIPVKPKRRGVYPIRRIKLSSTYPLGLFCAWVWIPVKLDLISYPIPKGIDSTGNGQLKNGARFGSLSEANDFSGFRKYRPGDSIRHIFWRGLVKGRPLLVKEFKDGSGGRVRFRWQDTPQSEPNEKLAQLSYWIFNAHNQGMEYSLEIPGTKINSSIGESHFYNCLKELARFELQT